MALFQRLLPLGEFRSEASCFAQSPLSVRAALAQSRGDPPIHNHACRFPFRHLAFAQAQIDCTESLPMRASPLRTTANFVAMGPIIS